MGILGNIIRLFRKKEEKLPEEAESSERDLRMPNRAMATDFEPTEERNRSSDINSMILTKLDMISMKLDNLDRRLQYVEKVAKESEK